MNILNQLKALSYHQASINQEIEIYSGKCEIKAGEAVADGVCRITCSWHPNPVIRFHTTSTFMHHKGNYDILINLHDWGHIIHGHVDSITYSFESDAELTTEFFGKLNQQGFLFPSPLMKLGRLMFHIINLHNIDFIESNPEGSFSESDRMTLISDDWRMELHRVDNLGDIVKSLDYTNGYASTHVLFVERLSIYHVSYEDSVHELGEFLTYFLSFHRGSWVSVCLPIGFNVETL
ncbi:hypothetical protein [Deinococcus aestuarii]|uniref:hypothetical protein n=1 Tax=Deinococcus aestuarii TaxID=2774531 RepID=UPI001C0CDE0E|nr:hypothetical protein [Deinococcus aestuarii]